MENAVTKKPIKVFSCGSVKAAIWADSRIVNDTIVEMHSVKIDRSYKDKDSGEWKSTNIFNTDELPKVAMVATEAYRFLRVQSSERENSISDNPVEASQTK